MDRVRFSGLVRLANRVQRELSRPIDGARRAKLEREVGNAVDFVDRTLRESGAPLHSVPGPSRRAYEFLRALKFDEIETSVDRKNRTQHDGCTEVWNTGEGATDWSDGESDDVDPWGDEQRINLRGLTGHVEHFSTALSETTRILSARPADLSSELNKIHMRLQGSLQAAERACQKWNLGPNHLTARSREHLGWLRFVTDWENLGQYVRSLSRALEIFVPMAERGGWPLPLFVHFRPTRSIFRLRHARAHAAGAMPSEMGASAAIHPPHDAHPTHGAPRAGTRVLMPTPMIAVDNEGFDVLARAMFLRTDRRRNAPLHALLMSEPYQELQAELEGLAGVVEDVQGMVHNLAESFHRVNEAYFDNAMSRPKLTWNRAITSGKFGHYNYSTDTVMISRALDRPHVPAYVVDHVMHHELLHKKHGLLWHRGRGHAHTREFREEERRFAQFDDADLFLKRLACGR